MDSNQPSIIEYSNCQPPKKGVVIGIVTLTCLLVGSIIFGVGAGCNTSYDCSFEVQYFLIIFGIVSFVCGLIVAIIFLSKKIKEYKYINDPIYREKVDNSDYKYRIGLKLESKNSEQLKNINDYVDGVV
jgi:hypothetical protein